MFAFVIARYQRNCECQRVNWVSSNGKWRQENVNYTIEFMAHTSQPSGVGKACSLMAYSISLNHVTWHSMSIQVVFFRHSLAGRFNFSHLNHEMAFLLGNIWVKHETMPCNRPLLFDPILKRCERASQINSSMKYSTMESNDDLHLHVQRTRHITYRWCWWWTFNWIAYGMRNFNNVRCIFHWVAESQSKNDEDPSHDNCSEKELRGNIDGKRKIQFAPRWFVNPHQNVQHNGIQLIKFDLLCFFHILCRSCKLISHSRLL